MSQHFTDTRSVPESVEGVPSSSSLYHFKFLDIGFHVGVPNSTTVLQMMMHNGLVGLLFQLGSIDPYVFL